MHYKPDWPDAKARLTALWNHEVLDRPCIAVTAPNGCSFPHPPPPAAPRDRWLDPGWVLQSMQAQLENTWWGGEAVPSCLLMAGWVLCLGGTPRFAQDTIWFDTKDVDFSLPPPFRYDAGNPWIAQYRLLLDAVLDFAGRDRFLVGKPLLLPANDLASMLMGTERFLLALVDHADWMREAIVTGANEQLRLRIELGNHVRARHEFWYGNAGWMPFWAPEPFYGTQSDVSCMLSPAMFDRFIVPELDVYGEAFGAVWYHLDGGDARQHLPRLLSLPYLKVVQYTPAPGEPPNGPEHLDLYREIQAAGRIVHIEVPAGAVEPLLKALDPSMIMLHTHCGSIPEGEALLDAAKHWV
ncbi:MAG: hypothetical protein BWY06_00912 [Candidatus Latescibacteria bacterium ADurb.Bin168]|nr:MAG: hypothetical protein BWY06_00912 [Candidatus Latescibacteria bacterium ADurb.Bin168]